MARKLSGTIQTSILSEDLIEYRKFLTECGYSDFFLSPTKDSLYLNLFFENPAETMKYRLLNSEGKFKSLHSNIYFYDLDSDWEDFSEMFNDEEI